VLAPVDPPFNNLSLLAASAFGLVSKAMREREREMFLPSLFFPRQTLLFFDWTAGKYSIALSSQFFPSERLLAFGVQIIRRLLLSFFAWPWCRRECSHDYPDYYYYYYYLKNVSPFLSWQNRRYYSKSFSLPFDVSC